MDGRTVLVVVVVFVIAAIEIQRYCSRLSRPRQLAGASGGM